MEVDVTDGIKVYDERGWAQVLPGPGRAARPHLRRGQDRRRTAPALEAEFQGLVEEIMAREDERRAEG